MVSGVRRVGDVEQNKNIDRGISQEFGGVLAEPRPLSLRATMVRMGMSWTKLEDAVPILSMDRQLGIFGVRLIW